MTEPIRAYWFCREDMTSPFPLDEKWEVGQTRELKGEIVLREWGFHGSLTPWGALQHGTGPVLSLLELSGTIVRQGDLCAASEKTLIAAVNIERELRLYAADCAERVLHIWETTYPKALRPRRAIQAARDYANGRIDAEKLAKRARAAEAAANVDVAWLAEAVPAAARAAAVAAAVAAAKDTALAARLAPARAAWVAAGLATGETTAERAWQQAEFDRRFGGLFND